MDWEQRYLAGDTPWEKGVPHPMLSEWLRETPFSGRVLVPGCGSGHDVREIARAGAEVVGLDLAPSAIRAAQDHPRAGREVYHCGDLFALPEEWTGTFDWVFEHTCFCAFPPSLRGDYVAAVTRSLKSGGRIAAVFFINPDHDEDGPPYGCSVDELKFLFAGFRLAGARKNLPTYPGRENREAWWILEKLGGS